MVARIALRIIDVVAGALPRNRDLADQFDLLADLMEIEGEDGFRIAAYRRAASRIRETGSSVARLALEGRARELQGIGKTIEQKIVEAATDGEIHALAQRRAEVPGDVAQFMHLPGVGPKTARRIWRELGITTLVDGAQSAGHTMGFELIDQIDLEGLARDAARIALTKLHARPAPSGAMPSCTSAGPTSTASIT